MNSREGRSSQTPATLFKRLSQMSSASQSLTLSKVNTLFPPWSNPFLDHVEIPRVSTDVFLFSAAWDDRDGARSALFHVESDCRETANF